jgi:DNA-binding transcriptional ArsR family regulator
MFPATWERLLAAWQDPDGRRTISVLREKGPLSVGKLRSAMGKSPRDLSRTVSWLRRQGVIRMVRSRGELEYGLSQGWVTFERHCRKDTQARLATFLAVLRADDLHPVVESIGGDRARVAVDGRRSRIRFVLPLDPLR